MRAEGVETDDGPGARSRAKGVGNAPDAGAPKAVSDASAAATPDETRDPARSPAPPGADGLVPTAGRRGAKAAPRGRSSTMVGSEGLGFPEAEVVEDFRLACVSRALDDREITLQKQSKVFFQISGAGHEALLLGLARSLRAGYDWFFPYYRDRALMLGLGVSPYEILLGSVGSAIDPSSGGRQMPCHWGFADRNVVSQSSPTGSQCLQAVGCAEAGAYIVRRGGLGGTRAHADEVTYVSLGEGATSEGEFWESLNTACTLSLGVLYVIEDNGYAISVPASDQAPAPVSELVSGFAGLTVMKVDGCDYFASRKVGEAAVAHIRGGNGPVLIHATVTRPYSHSSADTQAKYRSSEELAREAEADPIKTFRRQLTEAGVLSDLGADEIEKGAYTTAAEAAREALAAPRPDPKSAADHVWDLARVTEVASVGDAEAGPVVAMGEAIRRTLSEVMEADSRVRVFGEDVGDAPEEVLGKLDGKGGVFGTTLGLQRRFGPDRCYNTPLAEANIVGRAVGQALRGLRPAPEIQFFDFIWTAMQQLRSEAATMRWRSNGAFSVPMVLRAPIGGYLTGGAIWHSQSGESIFAHIPGIFVVFPSCAADAAGLMRTAFLAEDPVLFLEHKHLLRQGYTKNPYPGPGHLVPFGKAATVREGDDVSIVTYGAMVERSRKAAAAVEAEDGISCEIIDLRTISPWDQEAVAQSVARTGRLLVVHEDVITAGFGAEVAAWVASECFSDLDAPVRRVGAKDLHVAYEPTLEREVLPQVEDVAQAIRALAEW